jgi:hypothetical protein
MKWPNIFKPEMDRKWKEADFDKPDDMVELELLKKARKRYLARNYQSWINPKSNP